MMVELKFDVQRMTVPGADDSAFPPRNQFSLRADALSELKVDIESDLQCSTRGFPEGCRKATGRPPDPYERALTDISLPDPKAYPRFPKTARGVLGYVLENLEKGCVKY